MAATQTLARRATGERTGICVRADAQGPRWPVRTAGEAVAACRCAWAVEGLEAVAAAVAAVVVGVAGVAVLVDVEDVAAAEGRARMHEQYEEHAAQDEPAPGSRASSLALVLR